MVIGSSMFTVVDRSQWPVPVQLVPQWHQCLSGVCSGLVSQSLCHKPGAFIRMKDWAYRMAKGSLKLRHDGSVYAVKFAISTLMTGQFEKRIAVSSVTPPSHVHILALEIYTCSCPQRASLGMAVPGGWYCENCNGKQIRPFWLWNWNICSSLLSFAQEIPVWIQKYYFGLII